MLVTGKVLTNAVIFYASVTSGHVTMSDGYARWSLLSSYHSRARHLTVVTTYHSRVTSYERIARQ